MVAGFQALFVVTAAREQRSKFAWLDVATRQLSPLPISTDGVLSQRLSPDGREIAFHVIDDGGVINVWTQSLDGGARKQITFDAEAISYPDVVSGRQIAGRGGQARRRHAHGCRVERRRELEMLVTERGQSWPFSWAPDNDRIAFAGARDGVWNIYTVSRKTKEVRQLTDFNSVEGYVRYPSWSLDTSAHRLRASRAARQPLEQ